MADISEEELKKEIEKILKKADLTATSAKTVRQELEKSLGKNLVEKKNVIRQLVMDYVDSMENKEDEDGDASSEEDDEDEEDEEEEKKKKPSKRPAPASKAAAKKKKKESSEDEEEGTNDSESEEEEKKKPPPKKKGGKKKKGSGSDSDWGKRKEKSSGKPKKGGRGGGYTRSYRLSPALAELMGAPAMPRHEVVKRMWAMIKEKQLHDPNNKQFAICDDALYKVFNTKRFRTFGMMKYLKNHFLSD